MSDEQQKLLGGRSRCGCPAPRAAVSGAMQLMSRRNRAVFPWGSVEPNGDLSAGVVVGLPI
jgi:hypothetical protein